MDLLNVDYRSSKKPAWILAFNVHRVQTFVPEKHPPREVVIMKRSRLKKRGKQSTSLREHPERAISDIFRKYIFPKCILTKLMNPNFFDLKCLLSVAHLFCILPTMHCNAMLVIHWRAASILTMTEKEFLNRGRKYIWYSWCIIAISVLTIFLPQSIFDWEMSWNVKCHDMLMLDLWLQAETPGVTHFGAYHRPPEWDVAHALQWQVGYDWVHP